MRPEPAGQWLALRGRGQPQFVHARPDRHESEFAGAAHELGAFPWSAPARIGPAPPSRPAPGTRCRRAPDRMENIARPAAACSISGDVAQQPRKRGEGGHGSVRAMAKPDLRRVLRSSARGAAWARSSLCHYDASGFCLSLRRRPRHCWAVRQAFRARPQSRAAEAGGRLAPATCDAAQRR